MPKANNNQSGQNTKQFQSVAGVIFSCLGCVVGTGNLWRFPRIVARNSGEEGAAAFYLVWAISLLLWSIPLLVIEYALGRFTRTSVVRSFTGMMGRAGFTLGGWVVLINFFIVSYYLVILSWCTFYVVMPMYRELPSTEEDSLELFDWFSQTRWPLIPHVICLILSALSVLGGVKTIEKVNMVLVPVLLIILLGVFFYSSSLPYSGIGLQFLFTADWSTLTNPSIYLDALSQNAFDTAAASGLITTYAVYLTRQHSIVRYAIFVPIINNAVSFLASLTLFPTVFSTLLTKFPTATQTEVVDVLKGGGIAGTGLTFLWIPVLLSTLGGFGRFLCVMFFLCLSFAGISSIVSSMELFCTNAMEIGINRKMAVLVSSIALFLFGVGSSLDLHFLANQDTVWAFALIISGIFYISLVYRFGPFPFRSKIVNGRKSNSDFSLPIIWVVLITVVVPIEAIGLLVWWIYNEISSSPTTWYIPSFTSLITTWIEWIILATILIILNLILVRLKVDWLERKYFTNLIKTSPGPTVRLPQTSIVDGVMEITDEDMRQSNALEIADNSLSTVDYNKLSGQVEQQFIDENEGRMIRDSSTTF